MRLKDLTGLYFGKLLVIERGENIGKHTAWRCQCLCGNTKIVQANHLIEGSTTSCGRCADSRTSRLYKNVWNKMFQRCYNEKDKDFPRYGGRGISICAEWHDYTNFRNWAVSHGYNESAEYGKCTLDRIDVNGNYSPANCRFVDMKAQSRNKRNNHLVTYNGATRTISEWAEITNISANALYNRINRGWDLHRAFTQSVRGRRDDTR